jgi:nuclear pore complex protein Nup155
VKSILIDDARSCLYSLSKDNNITLFYLGDQGNEFIKIMTLSGIYSKASVFQDFVLEEKCFEIIGLHSVLRCESKSIQLLAVTSSGHRLYFSHKTSFESLTNANSAPTQLKLVCVRSPIGSSNTYGYAAIDRQALIHHSFYSAGLLLASHSFSEELDRILGSCPDVGAMMHLHPRKYLIDQTSFMDTKGKTWAIAETQSSFYNGALSMLSPGKLLNEFWSQFEYFPRTFRLLSNEGTFYFQLILGITVVTKLRPLDILFHLINSSQDMRVFADFFDKFGKDQSCAMCLAIACSHSSINYAKYDSVLPQLTSHTTNLATKLYFELGGKPISGQGSQSQKSRNYFYIQLNSIWSF